MWGYCNILKMELKTRAKAKGTAVNKMSIRVFKILEEEEKYKPQRLS